MSISCSKSHILHNVCSIVLNLCYIVWIFANSIAILAIVKYFQYYSLAFATSAIVILSMLFITTSTIITGVLCYRCALYLDYYNSCDLCVICNNCSSAIDFINIFEYEYRYDLYSNCKYCNMCESCKYEKKLKQE